MKASTELMSPSEVQFCDAEIQELLEKGLIEPSKIPWACRAFVVNKHSEVKSGKPRLVVNYQPLNEYSKRCAILFQINRASCKELQAAQSSANSTLSQGSIRLASRLKTNTRHRSLFHMVSTSEKFCHSGLIMLLLSSKNEWRIYI